MVGGAGLALCYVWNSMATKCFICPKIHWFMLLQTSLAGRWEGDKVILPSENNTWWRPGAPVWLWAIKCLCRAATRCGARHGLVEMRNNSCRISLFLSGTELNWTELNRTWSGTEVCCLGLEHCRWNTVNHTDRWQGRVTGDGETGSDYLSLGLWSLSQYCVGTYNVSLGCINFRSII